MTPQGARDYSFEVEGLRLAALGWGDPAAPPVLALHGWLDNAASFARLAPLLDRHFILAIDLPGHGQSAWRSVDATYQIYDDLPQLHALLEHLGWERCALLGHSRGAIMSVLYAASFPERVSRLVLLDGLVPQPTPEAEFSGQLRQFVLERARYLSRQQSVYPSLEKAISVREAYGLPPEAARLIVPRNLVARDGGFCWTTDPRLRGASAIKLSVGQIESALAAVAAPALLLLAENGLGGAQMENYLAQREHLRHASLVKLPGGHHFHLEEGVVTLARSINQFLAAD
ncbi:alpha/beta fold hydrolase [Mangrovimicrobium sediminis]|uniref:alpha/beta fold hydrolase n=1 Tax=Mangrovimicrobium sediminis TaxID=2562682 RepID=UPI001436A72E|nr:alpha/beta hydrolase [Haliea sp. SAOS-164]